MRDDVLLSRDQVKAITDRALKFATADETRVTVQSGWSGNTRFAASEITTAGGTRDTNVSITSTVGRRRASASTNVLDDASLKRTVELAERLARLAPEDPELMPELEPQQYTDVPAYVKATAELGPEARALAVQKAIAGARERAGDVPPADLFVAGFLEVGAGVARAVATSKGLFAYHPATSVSLSTTARTPDGTGSGYFARAANDWTKLDPAEIGRRAADKAVASRKPQALEPGQYTVILEPQAVADFIPMMMGSLNARSADEGRSAFSRGPGKTKVGEKVADERVTILRDPADPAILGAPFDADGLPLPKITWIEDGVLKNLAYTRFWAQKQGVRATGGAGGGFGGGGGGGGGFKMLGGTRTTEQLVAETERGILVTRFWYIRFLDQRTVMLTGLTRDGTFLVENGKVTRSLKNFRWNESPLFALNKLEAIGIPERVDTNTEVPALKIRDFNFTSLSDAV